MGKQISGENRQGQSRESGSGVQKETKSRRLLRGVESRCLGLGKLPTPQATQLCSVFMRTLGQYTKALLGTGVNRFLCLAYQKALTHACQLYLNM